MMSESKNKQKPPKFATGTINVFDEINISSSKQNFVKTKNKAYEPTCYSLFDNGTDSVMESCTDNNNDNNKKETEKGKRRNLSGSQDLIKESNCNLHGNSEDTTNTKERIGGNRECKECCFEATSITSRIGGCKKTSESTRKSGRYKSIVNGKNSGTSKTDKTKQESVSNGDGEAKRKTLTIDKSSEIKNEKYILTEFDTSNTIKGACDIQDGPFYINHFDLVEIVIDNLRYKVSTWSIVGGKYIQGLDSNFLVTKFKKK